MGTEPSGPSVEHRGADPTGPLELAVVDPLERVEDVLAGAVGARVLEDLLLARRVVHPGQRLLDVDGAHHGPGLPEAGPRHTVAGWTPPRSPGCWPTRPASRWSPHWPSARARSRTSRRPPGSRSRTSPS